MDDGTEIVKNSVGFGGSLLYLFVVWPITALTTLWGWIWLVISSAPYLFLLVLIGVAMIPWVAYHDVIIEEVEFAMRCRVEPVYQEFIRPFFRLFQALYNPLICAWNGLNWWTFGLMQDVIYPALIDADIRPLMTKALDFILLLLDEFIIKYLVSGAFLTEYMDFQNICDAWIDLWTEWQRIVCYLCEDLCVLWKVQPVINPIPFLVTFTVKVINVVGKLLTTTEEAVEEGVAASGVVDPPVLEPPEEVKDFTLPISIWDIPILGWPINFFAFLGSDSLKDPELWCALENGFNMAMAVVHIAARMIIQILNGGPVDRPDGSEFWRLFCDTSECLIRAFENMLQTFWDAFIPFDFVFENMFCLVDNILCITGFSVDIVLSMMINIDKIVQYPADPYYGDVIKPKVARVLNLIGTPDPTSCGGRSCCIVNEPFQPDDADINCYWIDETDPAGGLWNPSRNQARFRMTECFCFLFERLLCDQTNTGMCFNPEIVGGFSICCLLDTILDLITDLLAGLFELTLNFYSAERFFRFLDGQKYTFFLKSNLVSIIDCMFSVFSLIPTVGDCLRIAFVRIFAWLLCIVEWLIRYVISLLIMPYSFITGTSNFATDPARGAIEEWEAIMDGFASAQDPTSFVNCACFILNFGVPIPPIPCPTCEPSGFIPPPPDATIELRPPGSFGMTRVMDKIVKDPSFAFYGQLEGLSKLTPIQRYKNETMVPWELRDMILENSPYITFLTKKDLGRWDRRLDEARTRVQEHAFYDRHPTFYDDDDAIGHDVRSNVSGIRPTKPPIVFPCEEDVPCFDLCCYFRALAQFWSFILAFAGRIVNSLVQAGSADFSYWTEGGFEADLTLIIRLFSQIWVCLCDLLNLVIPVTPFNPRPDFCCAIIRLADLVACILQTTINSIKSLAMGKSDGFTYFTEGGFENDIGINLDLTFEMVVCACNLARAVLPFADANGFDICCIPETYAAIIIEILRWFIHFVLNLALIRTTGKEYFQLADPLNDSIDDLPFVIQTDAIVEAAFGVGFSSFEFSQLEGDQGTGFNTTQAAVPVCGQPTGGIPFCICNLLDTIIPARPQPGQAVGDPETNCPYINLCCFTSNFFNAIATLLKFLVRTLATLWQEWDIVDGRRFPTVFYGFMFCNEDAGPGDLEYSPSCGQLDPFIDSIISIVSVCPCEFLQFADLFLSLILPNWDCLCGASAVSVPDIEGEDPFIFAPSLNGILPKVGLLLREAIRIILQTIIRRFPNPDFWRPNGTDMPSESFTIKIFGPLLNAICNLFIQLGCPLDAIVVWIENGCSFQRQGLFRSIIAWTLEIFIRSLEFVEGFALFFAQFQETDVNDFDSVGGDGDPITGGTVPGSDGNEPGSDASNPTNAVNTEMLTAAIMNIVLLPLDALIADSFIVPLPPSRDGVPLATCPDLEEASIRRPADGIFLALLRYLACILGPIGNVFYPFIMFLR